jgi:formylglycine-generating enzyme required for sulfatase activity
MGVRFLHVALLLFLSTLLGSYSLAQGKKSSRVGQTIRDCAECPEMVIIPAGSFMMGSPDNEIGRSAAEGPQHRVTVQKFAVGKFLVTKKEWAIFAKETQRPTKGGCCWAELPGDSGKPWEMNPTASWNNIGFKQDSSHPVVCITWYDAMDYINWLSELTGHTYRMLTEAEWEYAARAGTSTAYDWGDEPSHNFSNYGMDDDLGDGCIQGRDRWLNTSPVGSFPPNQFGLYDMLGNVSQYLADCFKPSYINLPNDGSANMINAPLNMGGNLSDMDGTSSCDYRVIRGANFGDSSQMLRCAFRNWAPGPGSTLKTYRNSAVGFRVARTL